MENSTVYLIAVASLAIISRAAVIVRQGIRALRACADDPRMQHEIENVADAEVVRARGIGAKPKLDAAAVSTPSAVCN